ncbi:STAS domain-containing protein [Chondromyces crocatus]|uniref:Anti-anti-sigma factor n=1 Tax=Chondromyces crocatus TaxID=52 RepID=A0A0K1EB49_CHOCO|nr:STAS domain-containing protein [Chondromyces crocatus]AKT38101.1 anti-anti-sigma factor [Chondromyces crocatus]
MAANTPSALLDSFFSTCPELLFVAAIDGRLELTSAALRHHVGAGGEAGAQLLDLIHPKDRPLAEAALARLRQSTTAERLDVRLRDVQGAYGMATLHAACTQDGTAIHGSLRLDLESPPRIKELLLEALAKHLPAVIWGCNLAGTFIYQEGQVLDTLGLRQNHFLGHSIFDVYGDVPRVTENVHRAINGELTHYFTTTGEIHWESWVVPIRDAHGDQVMVLGFSIDITRVRNAEDALRDRLAKIEQQQEIIRRLSTPIIEVWDGVLTLPMLGVLDSTRTAEVMDNLLDRITQSQARYAVLDLTGVEVVDTGVAGYLLRLVNAIRLLGAEGIVAGIRPTVAQTMITLGADLSQIVTHRNLRAALSYCIRQMSPRGAPGALGALGALGAPDTKPSRQRPHD